MSGMSVENHAMPKLLLQSLPEMVAQCTHPIRRRKLAGLAKTNRKQRALGAGPPATLVSGPVHDRFEANAAVHEQGADTLGRIDLVPSDRQEIDAKIVD